MIGFVDENNRALIDVSVRSNVDGEPTRVIAWIDTAFDGHLVFSSKRIKELGLDTLVETEAILADGTKVVLEIFLCFVDWFGERVPVQVIANEGKFPLLGTGLLDGRVLSINYIAKELVLG